MNSWLASQSLVYWSAFSIGFVAIGLWETFRPLRRLELPNGRRWAMHIVLATLGQSMILLMPVTAAVIAHGVGNAPWAVMGRELPLWAQCAITLPLLDFFRWFQHFCMHRIGFLWRIHQVHHSDPDYDLTTTLRFHPLEAVLLHGSYLFVVAVLAPPVVLVIGFEALQLIQNFFGHANADLPPKVEQKLRPFLITPRFHRIHHSQEYGEQNSNFGIAFPFWDRLFGTYVDCPAGGHEGMRIGLRGFASSRALNLVGLLLMPFKRQSADGQASDVGAGTVSRAAPPSSR
jgi:sterol desaturase/sphingolipid hydroxylase (fatty acid hydroxylase superfamily)